MWCYCQTSWNPTWHVPTPHFTAQVSATTIVNSWKCGWDHSNQRSQEDDEGLGLLQVHVIEERMKEWALQLVSQWWQGNRKPTACSLLLLLHDGVESCDDILKRSLTSATAVLLQGLLQSRYALISIGWWRAHSRLPWHQTLFQKSEGVIFLELKLFSFIFYTAKWKPLIYFFKVLAFVLGHLHYKVSVTQQERTVKTEWRDEFQTRRHTRHKAYCCYRDNLFLLMYHRLEASVGWKCGGR